jgi:hypothetical protein
VGFVHTRRKRHISRFKHRACDGNGILGET